MAKVLISAKLDKRGTEILQAFDGIEVMESPPLNGDALVAALRGVQGLIVRSETKVGADVLEKTPDLKVIGRAGTGYDNIDAKAAADRGVAVLVAPGGNTLSAAEHTLALMFALARHIPQANAKMRAGEFDRGFKGVELAGKTLGVLGLGNIGAIVAQRGMALGMRAVGHDPLTSPERAAEIGVELLPIYEVIKQADFLTLHTPLVPETKHLVGKKALELCKPGLRVINCARGGLIDEAALLDALNSGKVAGAALDVFEHEPPEPGNALVNHPKVVCTPHLGASTEDAQVRVAEIICRNVGNFLTHGEVVGRVN